MFVKFLLQKAKNIWLKKTLVSPFLQIVWMSASVDIANFLMSAPFLVWGGHLFKSGQSLNFSAVKRGADSKGAFI